MSLTLQQALADFVLQCFDLAAQRGLRQKNFLRGTADVARFGHSHEITQLSEFHASSINRMQAQANNLALVLSARNEHPVHMKTTETTLNIRRAKERGHADHG